MADKQKTVATPDDRIADLHPAWELCESLMGGTAAMRAAGEKYLPRWPKEDADAYRTRLAVSVLFPGFGRTVTTLAGKPLSKPLTLSEDMPSQVREWCEDIDLEGRNLHAFTGDCMVDALGIGFGGILVDYPTADSVPTTAAGVRTLADERAAGLRPYWVRIEAEQVLGFRAERQGAIWRLTQLRLMECVDEPDGEFGMKSVQQVRVLEPTRWRTYREEETSSGKEWVLFNEGPNTLGEVPFAPFYGKRISFMAGVSPLLELAHLNVAHWQSASDQQNILHVARVPILCAINVDDQMLPGGEVKPWEMTVGAGAAVRIQGQNARLEYVEHTGAAIEAGAKDLEALEERMRQAGAELLVIDTKITATQVATENAVGMCALQAISLTMEDALNRALALTSKWAGLGDSGGSVKLYADYGAATLQEASAQLLLQANQAGKISDETFFSELKRRGIVSADSDWQSEKDRIAEQGPDLGTMGGNSGGAGGTGAA